MFEEEFFEISPVNFFRLSIEGFYKKAGDAFSKKFLLPDTSSLCNEESFAKVYFGWNEEELEFLVEVDQAFSECFHPDFMKGDSVELMIDTRDVKTSGYNTRFCHHFLFLPEAIEGVQAEEITSFRTEDKHELCDASELKVQTKLKAKSFSIHIHIPKNCLVGYDPDQFNRLGLTYRINRFQGQPQHFSVRGDEFPLEQQPSLWSSVQLIKK